MYVYVFYVVYMLKNFYLSIHIYILFCFILFYTLKKKLRAVTEDIFMIYAHSREYCRDLPVVWSENKINRKNRVFL